MEHLWLLSTRCGTWTNGYFRRVSNRNQRFQDLECFNTTVETGYTPGFLTALRQRSAYGSFETFVVAFAMRQLFAANGMREPHLKHSLL
jgi:hypothetical protein